MPYTPPAGSAANFTAQGSGLAFPLPARLGPRNYEPQDGDDLLVVAWGYPNGAAINFIVPAATFVEGVGAVTVEITAAGIGEFFDATTEGDGSAAIGVSVSGDGAHGVAGSGAVGVSLAGAGQGAHGVAGYGACALGVTAAGVGVVERYELTGEVRLQGILVDRLVRAYRRDTGELVGEAPTAAGRFKIHTGFAAREHFIVPIDTGDNATDWTPPCANRVLSILAMDTA